MVKSIWRILAVGVGLILMGCVAPKPGSGIGAAGEPVQITLLQINDLYELTPVGKDEGGIARVATLLRQLRAENSNTISLMAGDLFSPSALGTAVVGGKKIAGAQMVAVLNAAHWDYMTFGNHEFDLNEEEFKARMREARFKIFTSNILAPDGGRLAGAEPAQILTLASRNGDQVKLGLIGLTMDALSKTNYIRVLPPVKTGVEEATRLRPQVDVLVLVTHLPFDQDLQLAAEAAGVDLIIGGHEHENIQVARGPELTPICKADANVRTAYIHRITVRRGQRASIVSELRRIDRALPEDPEVKAEAERWRAAAFQAFRAQGFEPEQELVMTTEALDGREAEIRNQATRLTQIIADGMLHSFGKVDAAFYNAGSIRIDDLLQAGALTQYDVLRIMPFGGDVVAVQMPGDLLKRALDQGVANKGAGGFLHRSGIRETPPTWEIGGKGLAETAIYTVAVNSFLLTGQERGLGFMNPKVEPRIKVLDGQPRVDVRKSLIEELKRIYGNSTR